MEASWNPDRTRRLASVLLAGPLSTMSPPVLDVEFRELRVLDGDVHQDDVRALSISEHAAQWTVPPLRSPVRS